MRAQVHVVIDSVNGSSALSPHHRRNGDTPLRKFFYPGALRSQRLVALA